MNPIVIDLSHWNAEPDWTQLASAGTMGVIHKATQGTGYLDPTYAARIADATDAGLMWASYHFLEHDDIDEQMEWYVACTNLQRGERAIIDFEDPATTRADLENAVGWLFDNGYEVTVYGNGHLSDTLADYVSPILSRTSLWQARYSDEEPKVPPPWLYWSLWQYTDKAMVKGISEPVDANEWNGNPDNLIEWFNGASPKPAPLPDLPVVDIKIQVDRDAVIYVNGQEIRP